MIGSSSANSASDDDRRANQDLAAAAHKNPIMDTPLPRGWPSSPIISTISPLDLDPSSLLEIIVANSPFANVMVAADGRIVAWNKASERLLGYRAEEIIGQHVRLLMPGLPLGNYERSVLRLKAAKSVTVGSVRRHKDGTLIAVEVTATYIESHDGIYHGVLSTLIDKRQRNQEIEENACLATIVRSSPVAVVSVDTDRKVRTWNAAAEKMFGYRAVEIIGQHLEVIVPQRLRNESSDYASKVGDVENVDWNTSRLAWDGTEVPVNVIGTPIKTDSGIPTGWALFYRDISDRLEAQRALKESEEFTRSILAASLDWVAVVDGTGAIFYCNRGLGSIGSGDASVVTPGTSLDMFWSQEAAQVLRAGVTDAIRSGASHVTAWRRADGETRRWYDIVIVHLPMRSPNADRTLIMARDVTDKKTKDDHIELIVKELSHRAKNLLSVITAMARSTISQSRTFEDFETSFCARIHGLARSHDLLVKQDWLGVGVLDLARQHLLPFVNVDDSHLSLTGTNVFLPPALAQAIGMAFHELATNAVKYGALNTPAGHLSLACVGTPDGYNLRWTESGGPIVSEPQTRGFGHIVVEEMVSEALGCDARVVFDPHGVVWTAIVRHADVSEVYQTATA